MLSFTGVKLRFRQMPVHSSSVCNKIPLIYKSKKMKLKNDTTAFSFIFRIYLEYLQGMPERV